MTKPRKEPVSRPHHLCHIDWFITLRVCVPHLVTAPSRDVEHRPRYIPYDRNALVVDYNSCSVSTNISDIVISP